MSRTRSLSDPEVQKEFLRNYRNCGWIKVACKAAGIYPQRFHHWYKLWREGDPDADEFHEFFSEFERTLAREECRLVGQIKARAKGTRGKMWWLAKRFPERYGRRDAVAAEGIPVPHKSIEEMTEGEVRAYIATVEAWLKGKLDVREQQGGGGALPGPVAEPDAGDQEE